MNVLCQGKTKISQKQRSLIVLHSARGLSQTLEDPIRNASCVVKSFNSGVTRAKISPRVQWKVSLKQRSQYSSLQRLMTVVRSIIRTFYGSLNMWPIVTSWSCSCYQLCTFTQSFNQVLLKWHKCHNCSFLFPHFPPLGVGNGDHGVGFPIPHNKWLPSYYIIIISRHSINRFPDQSMA